MKAITTKYSNYRYTATDNDGNRVRVNADDALDTEQNHDAAAIALCRKMRWDGPLMRGTLKPAQRVYVFDAHANRVRFESDFQEQRYRESVEKARVRERLEYLRGEVKAERISYGELAELQSLVPYIDKGDVELLEAAGVPEAVDDKEGRK